MKKIKPPTSGCGLVHKYITHFCGHGWYHGHWFIGCILDNIYALSVSLRDSIGSITSYFHLSMVIHPGSNNNLWIHNLIHENMLSSSSKKQQNWKVSLNNGILGVEYKTTINVLMKHLYIDIRYFYFYITNLLISKKISRDNYKSTKTMKSNYFVQTIQWRLININKLELTKMSGIKSIWPKWMRL